MPIKLTLPDSGGSRRGRRRSSRNKSQTHLVVAIGGGIAAVGLLGLALYYFNPAYTPRTDTTRAVVPRDTEAPASFDLTQRPALAAPVEPTSQPEPLATAVGKIHTIKRVKVGNATDLHVEYEFLKSAEHPKEYYLAVSTPDGKGFLGFGEDSALRDTVHFPMSLRRMTGAGPINVWLEKRVGSERVSNVMTLP